MCQGAEVREAKRRGALRRILTDVSNYVVAAFANSIAHSVMGKSELLTVDLAFVLEATNEVELPERLLAVVRLHKVGVLWRVSREVTKQYTSIFNI